MAFRMKTGAILVGVFCVGSLTVSKNSLVSPAVAQIASADKLPEPTSNLQNNYELRLIHIANTYEAVRFRRVSGEAWTNPTGLAWEKIPEVEAPPAGDYDVMMVESNAEKRIFATFRIEKRTGKTWIFSGGKWSAVKEP